MNLFNFFLDTTINQKIEKEEEIMKFTELIVQFTIYYTIFTTSKQIKLYIIYFIKYTKMIITLITNYILHTF